MTDTRPAKRKFRDISTVTLYVGNTKSEFQVHEDLLCEASPFFSAAFTSNFKEGSEKTMTLPEDDADIFDSFIHWLYYQHDEIATSDAMEPRVRLTHYLKLCLLADKFKVMRLKHRLVDVLFSMARPGMVRPHPKDVAHVYENTPSRSGMRTMIADWYFCFVDRSWFGFSSVHRWFVRHPEFAADVLASFAKLHTTRLRTSHFKDISHASRYYSD